MQHTLAGGAAARDERRNKRASEEEYTAATTESVDLKPRPTKKDINVRNTYTDGDSADAYFAEEGNQMLTRGTKDNQLVVPSDDQDIMMPFAGFYDDVHYPVTTLFYPPHAPGELPPRVQMPPRPGPVYKNDLALCGERESDAQRMVSKIWRGIMARRDLQSNRTYEHILNYRARMIQCWWRTMVAQRRHKQLAELKKQWVVKRASDYAGEKQQGLVNMMTWQRRRFEGAAVVIQRVVRWHLNWCARRRCEEQGLPESQWPGERPCPIEHKVVRYFPWRRTTVQTPVLPSDANDGMVAKKEEEPRRRTILEFKKERAPVQPPPQDSVEDNNAVMRRKTRARAASLAHPEAQSRKEWKQEGLRKEDLDFNAGVIQRLFRVQRSGNKVRTAELTKAYMDKTVRIIARTFRMFILVKKLKDHRYVIERKVRTALDKNSKAKIAEIEHKLVWGKGLLDAAARTIQQCWHWYHHRRFGLLPLHIQKELDRRSALAREKQEMQERQRAEREEHIRRLKADLGDMGEGIPDVPVPQAAEEPLDERFAELEQPYEYEEPTAPPYNLIDDFLAREEELRDAMMNLLERNKMQQLKKHHYVTFTPEKVIVRKNVNTFVPKVN